MYSGLGPITGGLDTTDAVPPSPFHTFFTQKNSIFHGGNSHVDDEETVGAWGARRLAPPLLQPPPNMGTAPMATPQPYSYAQPYNNAQRYSYAQPYSYGQNYTYGANTGIAQQQCTAAVQSRLYNRSSVGGSLASSCANRLPVPAVTQISPRSNGMFPHPPAWRASRRYASNGDGPDGVGGYQPPLRLCHAADLNFVATIFLPMARSTA